MIIFAGVTTCGIFKTKQITEYVKNCTEFSKTSGDYDLAAAVAIAAATPEKRAKEVYISEI